MRRNVMAYTNDINMKILVYLLQDQLYSQLDVVAPLGADARVAENILGCNP